MVFFLQIWLISSEPNQVLNHFWWVKECLGIFGRFLWISSLLRWPTTSILTNFLCSQKDENSPNEISFCERSFGEVSSFCDKSGRWEKSGQTQGRRVCRRADRSGWSAVGASQERGHVRKGRTCLLNLADDPVAVCYPRTLSASNVHLSWQHKCESNHTALNNYNRNATNCIAGEVFAGEGGICALRDK